MIDSPVMMTLLLAAWMACAVPVCAAEIDAETDRQIVEYVLKTPTPDLDPKLAGRFLALDAAAMPTKKREKARAKQMELQTLLKISKGEKKSGIRWISAGSCTAKRYTPADIGPLLMAGFLEVEEDAVDYVDKKTNCTEDDLICEFTLSVVLVPRKKGPPLKRYLLHSHDPINALMAEYRGGAGGQTNFFGRGVFTCNH